MSNDSWNETMAEVNEVITDIERKQWARRAAVDGASCLAHDASAGVYRLTGRDPSPMGDVSAEIAEVLERSRARIDRMQVTLARIDEGMARLDTLGAHVRGERHLRLVPDD